MNVNELFLEMKLLNTRYKWISPNHLHIFKDKIANKITNQFIIPNSLKNEQMEIHLHLTHNMDIVKCQYYLEDSVCFHFDDSIGEITYSDLKIPRLVIKIQS